MNRWTKIGLIVATSLVFLGLVIFAVAMSLTDWDLSKLPTNKSVTNAYTISESYCNISVDTETANVTIVPSKTAECKVVCKEQERLKHSVTVQEDTLVIKVEDMRKWHDYVLGIGTTQITIYVPQVEINTITVKTSTGDVKFQDCDADEIFVKNSTGDITCTNVIVQGKISVKSSTGDVKFQDCDADEIFVKNSTGDVTGNFLTTKRFIAKTSTGEVEVPQDDVGGKCEITTSTGDIHFRIG